MDRFDAMTAFARVVETGSFTKAAVTLRMSKTTVTQLVQQLEARLRVKLLNRTTRKVNVTADGAVYYERVLALLADLQDAETRLPSADTAPRGYLRIDVPSPLASMVLVPALPDFYAQYPDIQLDMGVSDRPIDVIAENVDCVLRGGPIADQSLAARHVADLQLGVYASPAYLEHAGWPAHPRDLEQEPHRVVGFRWTSTGRKLPLQLERDGETVSVQGRYALALDEGNAYVAAGVAGLGALWLPEYMARRPVERGELVRLFADWRIAPMPLYAAWPPHRHVSPRLRAFVDWVAALMAQVAPVELPPLRRGAPS